MTPVLVLTTALSLVAPQAPKIVADPDLREMSTYTLTMENLNKVVRINKAIEEFAKKDPLYGEQIRLEKEKETLRKKDELTEADEKRLDEINQKLEALEEQESKSEFNLNDAKNLDEMSARINKFPPMAAILKAEGMPAREFAKFLLGMIQAGFAAGLQKAGLLKTTPEGVNPANIKFVLEHEEDLKKLQMAGPGGGGMQ
jgi:hypothetical protein